MDLGCAGEGIPPGGPLVLVPFTVTSWTPGVNGTVNTIAFNGGDCADAYIGGQFTSVDGAAARNIAEISTTTGTLVPGFRHNASGAVESIQAVDGHLLAGGRFRGINGSTADPYYASLNPVTGKNDGFVELGIWGHYQYKGVRANSTGVYNQQPRPRPGHQTAPRSTSRPPAASPGSGTAPSPWPGCATRSRPSPPSSRRTRRSTGPATPAVARCPPWPPATTWSSPRGMSGGQITPTAASTPAAEPSKHRAWPPTPPPGRCC